MPLDNTRRWLKIGDKSLTSTEAGRLIAKEAMAGDDGDNLGHLSAELERKMFRFERVGLFINVVEPEQTRRQLRFLVEHLPRLIAELDKMPEKRSKMLHAQAMLKAWNSAFHRGMDKRWGGSR